MKHSTAIRALLCAGMTILQVVNNGASAQTLPRELADLKPVALLPEHPAAEVLLQSGASVARPAQLTRIGALPADSRFRVETYSREAKPWAVEAIVFGGQAVRQGDVCLARFSLRSLRAQQETGEALLHAYFQQSAVPYKRSFSLELSAGPEWTTYHIPFVVQVDSEARGSGLYFGLGLLPQTVEFKAVEVLNFGQSTTLDQLPTTRFSYVGREASATWRAAALERIQKIRTAPLDIRVQNAAAKPLAGVLVQARLVQPTFAFGSAVDSNRLVQDSPEAEVYRQKVLELFDTVTIENGLKWQPWQDEKRKDQTLRAMDWIAARQLRLRGHTLVWPGWRFAPPHLTQLPNIGVELPRQITTRIEDAVTATRGRIWAWDVLNEPLHERDFFAHFPARLSAHWFKQARQLDPTALLFVNDYGMLHSRTSPDTIRDYLAFIKLLKDNDAPLDGIGVQGHMGGQVRGPVDVLADLDLLSQAQLPVQITEFDINTRDEELQADYTRDFLIACYSHPSVTGFIKWGFWQNQHWKPDAAMYRADWSEKPSAAIWREWVLGKWRTKAEGATDGMGRFQTRGHLGTYQITVSHGGKTSTHMLTLTPTRGPVTLTVPQ